MQSSSPHILATFLRYAFFPGLALLFLSVSSAQDSAPVSSPADTSAAGGAASPSKPKEPFGDEIAKFEADQKSNPPQPGAVLFVGSSTIKKWASLKQDFPGIRLINRGFGGATIAQVVNYTDRIVIPCKPRQIFVHAGDNDLAGKTTAQEVADSFKAFVDKVEAALPGTQITFISLKVAPDRTRITGKIAETNRLIEEYTKTNPKLGFVDIQRGLLGPDGEPNASLYGSDHRHLTDDGYKIFAAPIKPLISPEK